MSEENENKNLPAPVKKTRVRKPKGYIPTEEERKKFYWLYNHGPIKFDAEARLRCLKMVAEFGRVALGAQAAGVSVATVNLTKKHDPDFAEQLEEAFAHFRDRLEERAHSLAVKGWEEYVISKGHVVLAPCPEQAQRWRDNPELEKTEKLRMVPLKVHRYDSRILEMVLRRHMPEYRKEGGGVDVNIGGGGGLLVIPNRNANGERMTPEEFDKAFSHLRSPIIDVDATEVKDVTPK